MHADDGATGEQKRQRKTQAQVVIDRAQEKHQQHDAEGKAGAGRHNEDATLR
ncbi:hypothetical protein D3C81_2021610 [compost metagenome]